TIATNYANKGNFAGYTWKRDMINDAVYTCVRYAHNFDPNKQKVPNPFAYFTQICYHSFLNYIKKQNKFSKIKDTLYNNVYMLDENDQYMEKSIDYESLK
ncbi:sigma factor for late transcription, partial [Patescibacteria group bacterium]|nr:sigma factor for late transcription [Patescibacteria group bacterium]